MTPLANQFISVFYEGNNNYGWGENPSSPHFSIADVHMPGLYNGCFNEAGSFVAASGSEQLSGFFVTNTAANSLYATDVNGTLHTSWNAFIIDNPCGLNGNPHSDCLNGQFYANNNQWQNNNDR